MLHAVKPAVAAAPANAAMPALEGQYLHLATATGIALTVRLLRKGEPHGREFRLTFTGDLPSVEVYLTGGRPDWGGFGYFIGSYCLRTILDNTAGISLSGENRAWELSSDNIKDIKTWLSGLLGSLGLPARAEGPNEEFVLVSLSPKPEVYNFYPSREAADRARPAMEARYAAPGVGLQTMTWTEYEAAQRCHYLSSPLSMISNEAWQEAFNSMPPIEHRMGPVETFFAQELVAGSIGQQYARRGDRCFRRHADVRNRATWISSAEIADYAPPMYL